MPLGIIPFPDSTARDEKFSALQTRQNAIRRRETKTAEYATAIPPYGLWVHAGYGAVVDRCPNTLSFFSSWPGFVPAIHVFLA
jgi:hypothetical protein